jgi:Fe-S oxidoreductase
MKNMLMHVRQKVESDDKVKEIDPLVLICHGCKNIVKKYCKNHLTIDFVVVAKELTRMFKTLTSKIPARQHPQKFMDYLLQN